MIKTQIQLPDHLYHELKRVAAQKEWSFAETMRRAAEYIVLVHPPSSATGRKWSPPPPKKLGRFLAPEDEWTTLSHHEP